MKKTILTVIFMLCAASAVQAVQPIQTEGFDKYNNSFKFDVASLCYMSPQFKWERLTSGRFSYGVGVQAHFMNRSNAVRANDHDNLPTQVELYGKMYDLDWSNHPAEWYADAAMEDGTHEVKWDRKYVGMMVSPEGRLYFGRKPDRGFYGAARIDMGLFRETFVVSATRLSLAEENAIRQQRKDEAEAEGKDPSTVSNTIEDRWKRAGKEKGEIDGALGCGFGLGCQYWFGKNSKWGIDTNCFLKTDWKIGKDDNLWEWLWGVGLPIDFNLALMYRF